jgi:hypothetical protein
LADVFSSVVDGSKTAVQAVGDLLKSLGQMLINQGFQALVGGIFGGGGGLGNIFGGMFGGGGLKLGFNGIPGFANGTNFAPGGLAMVGERGPELVNLPRGSQVIPNEALGGGITIESVTVNANSEKEGAAGARGFLAELNRHFPAAMERYQRNPMRRSS